MGVAADRLRVHGYVPDDRPVLEIYRNSPHSTPGNKLITDLLIPIRQEATAACRWEQVRTSNLSSQMSTASDPSPPGREEEPLARHAKRAKQVKWPDVQARAARIFGDRVLPNLVLLEREEEPA